MARAVEIVRGVVNPPMIEVSGGVTVERLATLASCGVDAVSVGAITTKAKNVDIAMKIESE